MQYKYAIVITGGIAVGKSTVKNLLGLYGFACIDADSIAHKILDNNYRHISNLFGEEYIKIHSKCSNTPNAPYVDRKSLGDMIFKNKKKRELLQNLIHPKVQEEIQKVAQKQENKQFTYFIDIPLFFETKNYDIKNSLVVYTPKEIQITRLQLRDKFSYQQAKNRVEAQMDIEKKKKLATYIIDNSKDLKYLQNQCEEFAKKIEKLQL